MRGPGGARALQRPVWCMSTFNYKVYPLLQDLLSITRSTFKFNFYAYLQLTSAQFPEIYRKFVQTAFDLFDLGNRFSVFSWAWMLFIFQRTRYLSRSRGLWMCDRPNQYLKPIPWRCFNSSQVTQILWCPPDYACSNTFTGWVTASSQ